MRRTRSGGCRMQMKTSTYSRRSKTVSTVRKSQASVVAPCWRRKERQSAWPRCGAGGMPALLRTLRTNVAETSIPSLRSSPTIRRSPQLSVLARQPKDQVPHVAVDRRSTGAPVRVRPVAGDEPPMPAQQCLRPHHEGLPRAPRQHSAERRQEQAVALAELRPLHLPPQDRELMPQQQDLEFLRAIAAP
jgi:hypothetical protein